MKKHKAAKEREEQEFQYSGSDDEAPPEDDRAGEPSSILQAPGENTLRKNFQAIQDSTKPAQAMAEKNFSPGNKPKLEQQKRSGREKLRSTLPRTYRIETGARFAYKSEDVNLHTETNHRMEKEQFRWITSLLVRERMTRIAVSFTKHELLSRGNTTLCKLGVC